MDKIFGKFDEAMVSLRAFSTDRKVHHEVRKLFHAAGHTIQNSQRFYLPDAVNVLVGRTIDAAAKELIKLPYNPTVLLSETFFDDNTKGWKISIAWYPTSPPVIQGGVTINDGFNVMGLVFGSNDKLAVSVMTVLVDLHLDHDGYDEYANIDAVSKALGPATITKEMHGDVTSVLNLCTLLKLNNVTTTKIAALGSVNITRTKKGKLPLYSYHILNVDNERWDSPEPDETGTGPGKRSHLRRGHVRHYSNGHNIFVKAMFVRGSVPGFVNKDYDVSPA